MNSSSYPRTRDKPHVDTTQLEAALRQLKAEQRASPQNLGSGALFLTGRSTSGKVVTEQTSMQIAAVYACVRIIAESVAGLPLHLYRYRDGKKEKAIDDPLYTLLHDEPNPEMTSYTFRETMMTHLLLSGNAYAQKIRNQRGELIALYPLIPNQMAVLRDPNTGRIVYQYCRSMDDAKIDKNMLVTLDADEVFHIPGMGFNGLIGFSPIAMAKNAVGAAMAVEEYGAKFFANGAQPSGVLEHPGTIKNPEKLRETWQSTFGGSGNANKTAVLEEGLKYVPISISPEQAQFLGTRKFQLNEIARIFRIPPHMIGDLEKSSFSNIEQQSLEFVMYTLNSWLCRWEQAMHRSLLLPNQKSEYFWKFNVDGLLRGDYKSRMEGYAIARQNGWMSANDIHRLEVMDLIPADDGGDLYLINGNMLPLKDAGEYYKTRRGG